MAFTATHSSRQHRVVLSGFECSDSVRNKKSILNQSKEKEKLPILPRPEIQNLETG